MSDFSGQTRHIKAVRKPHECDQCGRQIDVGSSARYAFGIWEGCPSSFYVHPECGDAAREYAKLNDLWDEEWPWFQHMDDSEYDHHAWLLAHHPLVAERLNIPNPGSLSPLLIDG